MKTENSSKPTTHASFELRKNSKYRYYIYLYYIIIYNIWWNIVINKKLKAFGFWSLTLTHNQVTIHNHQLILASSTYEPCILAMAGDFHGLPNCRYKQDGSRCPEPQRVCWGRGQNQGVESCGFFWKGDHKKHCNMEKLKIYFVHLFPWLWCDWIG